MPDSSSTCISENDLNTLFPSDIEFGDQKYRFFTLPIDQVPGYDNDKPQLLVHRPNSGLQWYTMDQCLPIVTCVKLDETSQLVAERRTIVVFKDFEVEDCVVATTGCPPTPSP